MNTEIFPTNQSSKSYWSKPEGKIGTIFGIVLLGLIGYYVFPILTTVVWNTVNFAIACLVGFALYYILFVDKRIFGVAKALYSLFIKNTFGLIFKLDPFLIAEDYIKDTQRERENLYQKLVEVSAQKEKIQKEIQTKLKEKEDSLDRASAASKLGNIMAAGKETRQIARIDDFVKQLTPILQNLEKIEEYLQKVHTNSKYMLEDMIAELDMKKQTYHAVTRGNNALSSALKIFNGDPEKREMLEASMEFLKDDIAFKLASMKNAIRNTSEFMEKIDLQNATFEEKGLKMLSEYRPEMFIANGGTVSPEALKVQALPKYDNLLK